MKDRDFEFENSDFDFENYDFEIKIMPNSAHRTVLVA